MNQQIRIIGGCWRSRKITFPDIPGLRPSTDRMRETLFNWLAPYIQGAVCLDLFAGSGALGFEALSRGAKHVVFADQSPRVVMQLQKTASELGTSATEVLKLKVPNDLPKLPPQKFNIVFLDPPFKQNLLQPCCSWLAGSDLLAQSAIIYIEAEPKLDVNAIVPATWHNLRSKKNRHSAHYLYAAQLTI